MKYIVQQFIVDNGKLEEAGVREFSTEDEARIFYYDIDLKFEFNIEMACTPDGERKNVTLCKEFVIEDGGELSTDEYAEYGYADWKRDHY